MRAAVYYSNSDVRIENREKPRIGPDEILVQIKASGICGSDVLEWYRVPKAPLVLGHEIAGDVAEVGVAVQGVNVGDRVFVSHHVPCNMCRYCLAGHESVCDLLAATNFDPGGFCEYVRVPAVNVRNGLYKLPDNMSYEQAVFIEPLACVYRGHSHAGFMLGKTVLVIGSGIAGLLHIHLARVSGAVRIIAADVRQSRLDAALVFGADTVVFSDEKLSETVKAANSGRPVDVVITAAGAKSALEQAFRCVDKGGTILFFAPSDPGLTLEMPFNELWRKEITMTSTYAGSPRDIHAAIELIAAGRMKVQDMITHRLPLSRTQEGFSLVAAADDCMKVVVLPQE